MNEAKLQEDIDFLKAKIGAHTMAIGIIGSQLIAEARLAAIQELARTSEQVTAQALGSTLSDQHLQVLQDELAGFVGLLARGLDL